MNLIIFITFAVILISVLLGIFCLIIFKNFIQRIVVLDTITTASSGLILLLAYYFKSNYILDIAIVYAILSFGITIIIAKYKESQI